MKEQSVSTEYVKLHSFGNLYSKTVRERLDKQTRFGTDTDTIETSVSTESVWPKTKDYMFQWSEEVDRKPLSKILKPTI